MVKAVLVVAVVLKMLLELGDIVVTLLVWNELGVFDD